MKNRSIIPNIIGMIIISILLIFGASRCSGPEPQASRPDTANETAAGQAVSETGGEETEPAGEEAGSSAAEAEPAAEGTEVGEGSDVTLSFVDVPENEWYRDSVAYVFGKGLMTGVTDDTFAPNDPVDRGMLVTILHRMAGAPAAGENAFSDVTSGAYYEAPVAWAAENGIVNGYPDGNFGPGNNVTREQLAVILCRYAQYRGADTSAAADLSVFADRNEVNDYAETSVAWANAVQLINGVTEDTLAPQGEATRAQMAATIMRYDQQFSQE